ncbi:hypothetical protein DIZ76_012826 [Coccidioides immitis]|uniref:Metal binding domain of Ada family protein n=1 Tax=Coccidioides posadasii (strain C735) TaxID=222929 RepID=C5P775_COCP7|nr:Metal binding domain of Ada family protein [Coccidioides posadasii C735 delta SOWgp]EER27275.1 Metal binding domain of Ada family protein [Coccidioides posadasii C735 delta SOWgp]TPX23494.1 hypothetical protein DIZ76_012826 [Coccidioides immitis]|eukprot:XP_003069420.1 Metal binding domain of Ada family protein [Coccidioides posadasii C735 delta SOWgp]
MAYATPSARWRAIVNRDAAATCFVYGVRTTKIYCRPRCPARLARRANVIFYDTPAQAEKAGYRPCKRCKPEDLRAPTDPHVRLAQKACETMTLAALAGGEKQRPTLQDLASEAGLTPSHFHRVFKKVVGVTPGKYARDLLEGKTFQKKLPDGTIIGWPPVGPIGTTTSAQLQPQTQAQTPPSIPVPTTVPAAVQGIGLDLSNQSTGHDPGAVGIDWNEFDLMLAATTGGARPQMDYIGNGGFCIPATDHHHLDPSTVIDGSMFSANPQSGSHHHLGFPEYVNDTVDFSLGTPLFDSPALTTRPTSVPSSQQSLSPTDSPPLFDSCDSPLLFEDVDWMDNPGLPLTWKV